VFALLAEARQRIAATNAAIEAEGDFWLAETDLMAATLVGTAGATAPATTAPTATAEPADGH
jgi:hypothetical protein